MTHDCLSSVALALEWFPNSPQSHSQWISFLISISQKILLYINDVKFDFIMGCILVLFPFLWNVQFTNFGFLNFFFFKISDIGLLWSKITIFIIEIALKLLLHTKYGWNNPNWDRFCNFWQLKIHRIHKHSNASHALNFHRKLIFFNASNNVLYQNQQQLNY